MPDDGAPAAAAEAEAPRTTKVTILEDDKERREARKARVAVLAAADDEDIEKIKAHTMHKMVTDNANGTKVLFLTRKQADLVTGDRVAISRMLNQGFDIPDPKLVINLLGSLGYQDAADPDQLHKRRELLDEYMAKPIARSQPGSAKRGPRQR